MISSGRLINEEARDRVTLGVPDGGGGRSLTEVDMALFRSCNGCTDGRM